MLYRVALGEIIREERQTRKLNLRDLSDRGIISLGYLSEVERGQKEISSEILDSVACGLGVKPHDLIIKAGLLMAVVAGQTIPDTAEELLDNALAVG